MRDGRVAAAEPGWDGKPPYPPGLLEAAKLVIRWTAERRAAEKAAQAAIGRQGG